MELWNDFQNQELAIKNVHSNSNAHIFSIYLSVNVLSTLPLKLNNLILFQFFYQSQWELSHLSDYQCTLKNSVGILETSEKKIKWQTLKLRAWLNQYFPFT